MAFVITCTDKPDHRDLRAATREAHLAYLDRFADSIIVAGPSLDDDGQPNGSILVMRFDAQAGLFAATSIVRWRQTLPKE